MSAYIPSSAACLKLPSRSDLLRADPKQPEPLYYRGLCLYLSGQHDQAIKHCQEALRNDPDYSQARCVGCLVSFVFVRVGTRH